MNDPRYASRPLITRLWRGYLRRHVPLLSVAMALMVIEGATLGILSYMLKPLFDQVFVGNNTDAVWWVGGIILALFFVRAITLVVSRTLLTKIAQESSTEMQVNLVRHLVTLDNRFFQENPPGSLIERVQGDTVAVQAVWRTIVTSASRDLISLGSLLVVAVLVDPVWTLVALVGVPLLILPISVAQKYIRKKTAAMREEASSRATRLDEIFHGITAVKLNGMEAYQTGRFKRIVDQIVRAEIKITISGTSVPAMIDIVSGLGFFLVVLVGARDIAAGERTVGEFMAFFTAMALCFQPLRRLGLVVGAWQTAAASLERLYRLFDTLPQIKSPAQPRPAPTGGAPEIVLEDVCFAYGEMPVLRGVSFRAAAGKTTALVGLSGAGKSTIFGLLTRLEEPQSGQLRIAGQDVTWMDFTALRAMFSVVTQDAALFDETIRENILLGRDDIGNAHLTRILDAAHVATFVQDMPLGLETPAGPRGSGLSGGQRQRVAIARALVRDTPILLLDEATSALDTQSERMVQAALEQLSHGRTTLVIAHRLSTVRNADSIVVLDQGRVVAQGTHEALLAEGGLYAQLCRLQFDEGRAA